MPRKDGNSNNSESAPFKSGAEKGADDGGVRQAGVNPKAGVNPNARALDSRIAEAYERFARCRPGRIVARNNSSH
jgi:hypothetical protein